MNEVISVSIFRNHLRLTSSAMDIKDPSPSATPSCRPYRYAISLIRESKSATGGIALADIHSALSVCRSASVCASVSTCKGRSFGSRSHRKVTVHVILTR